MGGAEPFRGEGGAGGDEPFLVCGGGTERGLEPMAAAWAWRGCGLCWVHVLTPMGAGEAGKAWLAATPAP